MPSLSRLILMFLLVSLFVALIEVLSYRSLQRSHDQASWWPAARTIWWTVSIGLWALFVLNSFMWPRWRATHPGLLSAISVTFIVVMVPKLVMAAFQALDELRRLGAMAGGPCKVVDSPSAGLRFSPPSAKVLRH